MHYWGQVNSALSGQLSVNWHRMMVLTFERLMQKAVGDATFSLPYWAWSTGDNYDSDTLVAVGGNGDLTSDLCTGCSCPLDQDSDSPVVSFLNIGAFGVAEDTTIARNFACNLQSLPSSSDVERVVALKVFFGDSGFQSEAAIMHDLVHHWVGGTMSTVFAASDPLFFLHHVYVDLIFTRWMLEGSNAGYSDIDIATEDTDLEGGGDACMAGFFPLITHRQIWVETKDLGYTYDFFFGGSSSSSASATIDATASDDETTSDTDVAASSLETTTDVETESTTTVTASSAVATATTSVVAVAAVAVVAALL